LNKIKIKSADDKISILVGDFYSNLGTIQSIECIHSETNSEIHKITTKNDQYLLHHNMFDNDKRIEKMCQVLNEISISNTNVIKPIKNQFKNFSQNKFYVTKFENGKLFSGSKKEYFDLAKKLNILHKQLDNYNLKYNFRPNDKSYKLFTNKEFIIIKKQLLKIKHKDKIDTIIDKNISFIENQITKCSIIPKNNIFKKQLIHFDLHVNNILFINKSLKLFLDFNSMRKGYLIEDVLFCGFHFGYQISSNPKIIYNLLHLFLKKYFNKKISYTDEDLNYFLSRFILYRICFILRNHFFSNSNLWISEFNNQLKYLKLINKFFR
jgi:Ser/Thr protein kinase RdoA (MazF antagonist)